MTDRPVLNRALGNLSTTVFAEMSGPAARTGAIDLGQGVPDTDGPPELAERTLTVSQGFYADPAADRTLIRSAFGKRAGVLARAARQLAGLTSSRAAS